MQISSEVQYDFDDVMFLPQLTDPTKNLNSRSDVWLTRTFKPGANRPSTWSGVPIIAANMDTVGTMEMAEKLMEYDWSTALHKHYSVGELVAFYKKHEGRTHLIFYTMGISHDDIKKFALFTSQYGIPENICIDVANGYLPRLREIVTNVRQMCPNSMIMAGNVVTGDGVYALVTAGASIVKVGIGSGSACTTRRLTGVGRPQLTAVIECANAAHALNALICSDGGCVDPSHVTKAIGAGADFVMLGGMLSGHDECGGEMVHGPSTTTFGEVSHHTTPGKLIGMKFYGMSSETAMDKHNGGMANYKASEGRNLVVPYKGDVASTIETIMGGMRSTMMYIGAEHLKEISKCATFIPVNSQLNTSLAKYET